MTKETLTVKNFGPIKEATLDLRKVTVLIGEQASGKSVLAKLINIFSSLSPLLSLQKQNLELIKERLSDYKIHDFLDIKSSILYDCNLFQSKFNSGKFSREHESQELLDLFEEIDDLSTKYLIASKQNTIGNKGRPKQKISFNTSTLERQIARINYYAKVNQFHERVLANNYFPAERTLVPMLAESLFSLTHSEINIPKFVIDFGTKFEAIRNRKDHFKIPILGITYSFDGADTIEIADGTRLTLKESSSGFQSLIPMVIILDNYDAGTKSRSIIEEPELNLYPTTQKKFVEFLIEKCTKGDNRLIITTHSPYILTALNNCIQAKNVVDLHPDAADEVNKLVPPQSQIAYEDVMAYFVGGGTAKSIMNEEFQMIDANALDDVSNELGAVFDKLLDLKYQDQD